MVQSMRRALTSVRLSSPFVACRWFQGIDDLGGRGAQISQVLIGECFDRERRLDPKNVDRTVYAGPAQERDGDARQSVVPRRTAVGPTGEAGVTDSVTLPVGVRQNFLEAFRIAREPVVRFLRSAQLLQNFFALPLWTE